MDIHVLIIDSSAVAREALVKILSRDPSIQLMRPLANTAFIANRFQDRRPDVVILDAGMPQLHGLVTLRHIMKETPVPVVFSVPLSAEGGQVAEDAMDIGAVSFFSRPEHNIPQFLEAFATELLTKVWAAAHVRLPASQAGSREQTATPTQASKLPLPKAPPTPQRLIKPQTQSSLPLRPAPVAFVPPTHPDLPHQIDWDGNWNSIPQKRSPDAMLPRPAVNPHIPKTPSVVAIGTSAGGTIALEFLIPRLPPSCPAMVVVQHMPEKFTTSFAERIDQLSRVRVKEAKHGDLLEQGTILIAPGGKHLLIKRQGTHYFAEVRDGPTVTRHRPSVDVLFRSVATHAGRNAIGLILTGMGDDGAMGMAEMHECGARTIAQDEASCMVFGMPKEAIALGGVDHVMSLDQIATYLCGLRP
ncbi:chemotaxis-specific protein-glutamate methyltransferase CheB [Burkholderiaceae bacterium DAT-1]|nr:chemotaxis-specific protein-glutamate methyltransferase CheB [Burkholderiaceae bacterium DAT-1]